MKGFQQGDGRKGRRELTVQESNLAVTVRLMGCVRGGLKGKGAFRMGEIKSATKCI